MTLKVRNITELDNVVSTLIIDGYSDPEIQQLTKPFHDEIGTMDDIDYLISIKRLEMCQCLSQEWIVSKLKQLTEGDDALAAVKALSILLAISEKQ